jgi:GPH family glycoside/pentoside/hexuronide:cation symporter
VITTADGLRYGLLGLPLAFVALPLYVQLPARYAGELGVPLAALGAVLLGARLFDAVLDPWIGRWTDRLFARSTRAVLAVAAAAAVLLAIGFAMLFFPPVAGAPALLAWAALSLLVTYLAYSTLSVAHQSWGAMLATDDAQRARVVGWREGLGLAGVLLASVLPTLAGWGATTAVLVLALAAGCAAWACGRHPVPTGMPAQGGWWLPFAHGAFRRLLAVFLVNGTAAAVPATLLLFFVQDRLQLPRAMEAVLLGTYFLCAALSMPLWLRLVRALGLARSWLAGMVLSIAAFVWAALLGPGDAIAFTLVCALCGLALGSDLAFPGALLARVITDAGEQGRGEGIFFGWWQLATKLNLALAAGVALPLLAVAGYTPGARTPEALQALVIAYCLLPCLLKAAAAALLYGTWIRREGPTP